MPYELGRFHRLSTGNNVAQKHTTPRVRNLRHARHTCHAK